jgi:CheY-like chemotaxis protein
MSGERAIDSRCDITDVGANPLHTELVLIVDDDEDVLELSAETLRTLGYEVLTARNGLQAIAILHKNSRISTLFTDIQMPGMEGEELAKVAVALRPNMRVIFTSGYSSPCTHALFIKKPYKIADLSRMFSTPHPFASTS